MLEKHVMLCSLPYHVCLSVNPTTLQNCMCCRIITELFLDFLYSMDGVSKEIRGELPRNINLKGVNVITLWDVILVDIIIAN